MTCKFLAKRAQLLPEALTSYHRRPSIRPISHDMQIPCKARTTPPRSPDHLSCSIESLVSSVKKYFVRLVEKTETHILVGLLLLLFLILGLDSNGLEDGLDVGFGWGGVTTDGEEKVCCEVLHFARFDEKSIRVLRR